MPMSMRTRKLVVVSVILAGLAEWTRRVGEERRRDDKRSR